jgi:tetratricopeptide (TPR) repeat protein
MSDPVTESLHDSGGFSTEEWSILEPLLPDRWPDGWPGRSYQPALDAVQVSAVLSLLVSGVCYGVFGFASPEMRLIVVLILIGVYVLLKVVVNAIIGIGTLQIWCGAFYRRVCAPASGSDLLWSFTLLYEEFARRFVEGDAVQAERLAADACRLTREELGADHPGLAELLYGRALVLAALDDSTGAMALLAEADAIWRGALEPASLELADVDFALGLLYSALGDPARAEPHFRSCLEIAIKTAGPNSRHAASALHRLAAVREDQGDAADAEALDVRVLELIGNRPGWGSKLALIAGDRLTALALERRDHLAARRLLLRALWETRRSYPESHPFVTDRFEDLGLFYKSIGAPELADCLFERAEQIRREAFGADHSFGLSGLAAAPEVEAACFEARRAACEANRVDRVYLGAQWGAILQPDLYAAVSEFSGQMAPVRRLLSGAGKGR